MSLLDVEVRYPGDAEVRRLEYDVYARAGYIEPNEEKMIPVNTEYPDFRYIVVLDKDTVIASIRVVVDQSPRFERFTLPTFKSFTIWDRAIDKLRRAASWEVIQVGTTVVREDYRGGPALSLLLGRVVEMCRDEGIHYAVSTIDARFYRALGGMGFRFKPIGESVYYMGSVTVPVMLDFSGLRRDRLMQVQGVDAEAVVA